MVNWVVDDYILDSPTNIGDMLGAIKKSGANLFRTKYVPFDDNLDYGPEHFDKEPTILYGTVGFVKKCKRPFFPGAFGVSELMNCNHYYSHIPNEWLLNADYYMMPFNAVKNRKVELLTMFPNGIFLRPNSGFKTFTGLTLTHKNYDDEISSLEQLSSVMPETICLVSSAKELKGEFRFIVVNKTVIDGSEYRWDKILDIRHDYPADCLIMAQNVAGLDWQPDVAYTVDISLYRDEPKVVEINSFSCAGFYACDRDIIVQHINTVAEKMFNGEI